MSEVFVLNVNKPLSNVFLNYRSEMISDITQSIEISPVDEETLTKLQSYNINGFNYILGNQFMTFGKQKSAYYYEEQCMNTQWLQNLVEELISDNYEVSLISTFYGSEIEQNPQIKRKTVFTSELEKDEFDFDYYTVYKMIM